MVLLESILASLASTLGSTLLTQSLNTLKTIITDARDIDNQYEQIKNHLQIFRASIADAENDDTARGERWSTWVDQVKVAAYNIEDFIDDFQDFEHKHKEGGFIGHFRRFTGQLDEVRTARNFVDRIRQLSTEVVRIFGVCNNLGLNSQGRPSRMDERCPSLNELQPLPSDDADSLYGIEQNKSELLAMLDVNGETKRVVVSICGMGGLGKTTLVKQVYRQIKSRFEYSAWITVSRDYEHHELLKTMDQQLPGRPGRPGRIERIDSMQVITDRIRDILASKRYLIVLDDVWSVAALNQLFNVIPANAFKSRVMVTTRQQVVASSVPAPNRIFYLQALNDRDAHELFFRIALGNAKCPANLSNIAENIIMKCKGLPLAIVTLARLMSTRGTSALAWARTYNNFQYELRNNENLDEMSRVLMLGFSSLPQHLKRCFLYCTLFPEDYKFKTECLVRMLIAEGFTIKYNGTTKEETAEHYIQELCARNLLQVAKTDEIGRVKEFQIHDMMRDLGLIKSKGENLCVSSTAQISNDEDTSCRRLSILNGVVEEQPIDSTQYFPGLRTLLVYNKDPAFIPTLRMISSHLKYLRVLELRGTSVEELHSHVFMLFNLRYLGLRKTQVSELPDDVENLYNLQTLDLWKTRLRELPRQILKLQKLRNLLYQNIDAEKLHYHNYGRILRGEGAPSNLWDLKKLQTLKNVKASRHLVGHLGQFKSLRILGITMLDDRHKFDLRLDNCHHRDDHHRLPAHLQKLKLKGLLESIPPWFEELNSLTHLHIHGSQIAEKHNLIRHLQQLPNLVELKLDNAYLGDVLCFQTGTFKSLIKLSITNFSQLQQLRFEHGAMQSLQQLYLFHFKKLRTVEGYDNLHRLQFLDVADVPEYFDWRRIGR